MEKLLKSLFKKNEIFYTEDFYKFFNKKKIIVFVPLNFIEILTAEMSKAGAGVIGNYEMCSFRSEGTGTYKPVKTAKPYSGRINVPVLADEIKLEMECDADDLNKIIDTLLKNHPYEEVAYEIYDFRKRDVKKSGEVVELKLSMKYSELFYRLNKEIEYHQPAQNISFKKIVLTSLNNDDLQNSAEFLKADCMLFFSKKNYKLYKYK